MTTPRDDAPGAGAPSTDTAEFTLAQTDTTSAESTENPGVEQLQANIEQTRQELGQTVDALSAKLDVKSRTKQRMAIAKAQAARGVAVTRQRSGDLAVRSRNAAAYARDRRYAPAVPVAVVVVVAALVAWRIRHH